MLYATMPDPVYSQLLLARVKYEIMKWFNFRLYQQDPLQPMISEIGVSNLNRIIVSYDIFSI